METNNEYNTQQLFQSIYFTENKQFGVQRMCLEDVD